MKGIPCDDIAREEVLTWKIPRFRSPSNALGLTSVSITLQM